MELKPVRKIRPSNRSITGKASSQKMQKSHAFESSLERDYLTLLEFDDSVDSYGVQPLTIYYSYNNKPTRYTPDVTVHFKPELNRKPLLVEVKYEAELQQKKEKLEPKFSAARQYADENCFEFKVVTEKNIRTDLLYNIKFLSRYGTTPINETYQSTITTLIENKIQFSAQELLTHDDPKVNALILHSIWQMLAGKLLMCDMHSKITMKSKLWISEKIK